MKTLLVIPGKVRPNTLIMGAKNGNKKQEVSKEEYNAERVEEEQEENYFELTDKTSAHALVTEVKGKEQDTKMMTELTGEVTQKKLLSTTEAQ